jgi:hypothetical protein
VDLRQENNLGDKISLDVKDTSSNIESLTLINEADVAPLEALRGPGATLMHYPDKTPVSADMWTSVSGQLWQVVLSK